MDRDAERSDDTIQEGGLVIEERMNRREGLVEYEGTVGGAVQGAVEGAVTGTGADTELDRVVNDAATRDAGPSSDAMQAGAAVLAGTGSTALVDDAATVAGASDTMPSMSTDNTAASTASADTADSGVLARVREGMKVFDASGDEIGKVDYVKAGDPQAATTMGQDVGGVGGVAVPAGGPSGSTGAGGIAVGAVVGAADTGDLPDVDEPFRSELLRTGFFRVDGKGWFDKDRYITPDQIASVSGDGVTLKRHKDDLIRE